MKRPPLPISFLFAALALSGCSSMFSDSAAQRAGIDAGAGAGAGAIGYAASGGNTLATAGSALGGAVIADMLQGDDAEYGRKMMAKGVEIGTQVEAKRLYFALLNAQQRHDKGGNQQLRYYTFVVPPRDVDGMHFDAETIKVPIFDAVTTEAPMSIANPGLGRMVDGGTDIMRQPTDPLKDTVPADPIQNNQSRR